MSAQWMGYFFDNSDLEGSRLLLALAIADHADMTGRAHPGIALLSKKIRCKERQTRSLLRDLEKLGYVETVRAGNGRGHLTELQLKKVNKTMIPEEEERVQPTAAFPNEKGGNLASRKGAISRQERGRSGVTAYKEEPLLEPEEEPIGRAAPTRGSGDDRKTHPAIVAIREITSLFPPKDLWDTLIVEIGDSPDIDKLRRCFVEWRSRGYKPTNYAWARDWYLTGIPDPVARFGNTSNRPSDVGRTQFPDPFAISDQPATGNFTKPKPLRPAAECPAEHRELWLAFLRQIKTHVTDDAYRTWFEPIMFDGLNTERNALKTRTVQISHDWITTYYAEKIYESLIEIGLGEFTLQWEIEDEEYDNRNTEDIRTSA